MGLRDFIRSVLGVSEGGVAVNVPSDRLFENVRVNMKRGLALVQEIPPHDKVAILVGGGPSLADQVEEIRRGQSVGHVIFAQNGAAAFLVKHGIIPDYQVIVDARLETAALVCPEARGHFICSHCDPVTVYRTPSAVLFHPNVEGIDDVVGPEPCLFIGGSWTVGLVSMALAFGLGYRIERLFGYDSSLRGGHQHAYFQRRNAKEARITEVICGGQTFTTTAVLKAQAQGFQLLAAALTEQGCAVAVYGDGLIPTIAKMMMGTQPPRGELHVPYPLETHPASWNFYEWLLGVEIFRRSNCYSSLSISFTEGPDEGFRMDHFTAIKAESKRQIMDNVCRPLIRMMGATEGDGTNLVEDMQFPYTMWLVVESFNKGQPLPELQISDAAAEWAEQYRGAHVITLREAEYWKERNSNLDAWLAFAAVLRERGKRVVFVRDTIKAHVPIDGCDICPEASTDVDHRLALYRVAEMNYLVSNGPATLAMYSIDIPYICFMKTSQELDLHTGNWFEINQGVRRGEQWPWANDRQKMVWGRGPGIPCSDTFDEIMNAAGLVAAPPEKERERATG